MRLPDRAWLPFPVIALLVCVGIFVALYFAAVSTYWNISPDSASYVGFAKAFAAGTLRDEPPLQPPMTSILYTPLLVLFPDSYLALNALTRVLLLVALGFFYALIARRSGSAHALLIVVLTLASVSFYHASTQLLSEPTYMMFSSAALFLLDRRVGLATARPNETRRSRVGTYAAGVLMILTVATRTIGVALPLAVLAALVLANRPAVERDQGTRRPLITFALLSLLVVVAWDTLVLKGAYAGNWFANLAVTPPPVYSNGIPAPSAWETIAANIRLLPAVGGVLVNVRMPSDTSHHSVLRIAAALLFAIGLGRALIRRHGVTEIYVAIFVIVATFHMLVTGETDQHRFLVPVIPFLFTFALEPVEDACRNLELRGDSKAIALAVRTALALYIVGYVALGMRTTVEGVRDAHSSPFGSYPIRRPGNYDVERIALWVRDHSQPQDRYASPQVGMFDVVTERSGADILLERTRPPEAFVAWLDGEHVRYVFVDHKIPRIEEPVLAAIRAYPLRFRPLLELPRASLYEMLPG